MTSLGGTQTDQLDGPRRPSPVAVSGPARILVVVQRDLADRLTDHLAATGSRDAEVVFVGGFLAAMGEAARPGAPVGAVIGPVRHLAGMARSTAESLRRLAPQARLVVVREAGFENEVHEVLVAGFDAALPAEATAAELGVALGVAMALPEAAPAAAAPGARLPDLPDPGDLTGLELGPAGRPPAPGPDRDEPTPRPSPHDVMIDEQIRRQEPRDADRAPAAPTAPAAPGDRPDPNLGDTDLVEELLRGGGRLGPLALRLVAEQSGIQGIAWAHDRGDVPAGHAGAPLHYLGRDHGVLHAPPPATPDTLQPWAAWLARWVALEDQFEHLRTLSVKDELTGAWNRRYFDRFLARVLERAAEGRQQVTLLVFDIDDFKLYNDEYGHAAGDEILREVAAMMRSSVRDHDVVARIGGDEFAVIFWDAGERREAGSKHPGDVRAAAARFQKAITTHKFPKLGDQAAGHLSVSGGLAGFPWDGRSVDELVAFADAMAIRSKRAGKNAITFGPGAEG